MYKNRDKKKASNPTTTLDNFFSNLFAERRRPRPYDLWAWCLADSPELKARMDEQLITMYGSAEGRLLNERNAARRHLFEKLSEEEQQTYRDLAEQWKANAASPKPYGYHSIFAA